MIVLLSAALATAQRPAMPPPAPHAGSVPPVAPVAGVQPARSPQMLLAWLPGEVRCDGIAVAPAAMRRPLTTLAWQEPGGARTVTYRFRIDPAGRPLSIARDGGGYAMQTEDIAPSLAASRFPVAADRRDCAITYTARSTPLVEAPVADLMSYAVNPLTGPLPRPGWDRIIPAGADCRAPRAPRIRLRAYPDFDALPPTPGVRGWSMVGYDLDARGRPVRVRTAAGTRNPALDAAAVDAVRASRFTPGARTGCLYPYWQNPATIAAPPLPDRIGTAGTTDGCPAGEWVYRPTPVYPRPWHARGIEGWAVVAFDVAPWGEIGNVRVVASEPAAEFGQEALRLLRGARKPASATGHAGCIERVRFAMPATATATADPARPDD
jgi:TonB family protein